MKIIFKYTLERVSGDQIIHLPVGYEILAVQSQDNNIVLWALVGESQRNRAVTFRCIFTGEPFDAEDYNHIDTVQIQGIVWHVFRGN